MELDFLPDTNGIKDYWQIRTHIPSGVDNSDFKAAREIFDTTMMRMGMKLESNDAQGADVYLEYSGRSGMRQMRSKLRETVWRLFNNILYVTGELGRGVRLSDAYELVIR